MMDLITGQLSHRLHYIVKYHILVDSFMFKISVWAYPESDPVNSFVYGCPPINVSQSLLEALSMQSNSNATESQILQEEVL